MVRAVSDVRVAVVVLLVAVAVAVPFLVAVRRAEGVAVLAFGTGGRFSVVVWMETNRRMCECVTPHSLKNML